MIDGYHRVFCKHILQRIERTDIAIPCQNLGVNGAEVFHPMISQYRIDGVYDAGRKVKLPQTNDIDQLLYMGSGPPVNPDDFPQTGWEGNALY